MKTRTKKPLIPFNYLSSYESLVDRVSQNGLQLYAFLMNNVVIVMKNITGCTGIMFRLISVFENLKV